MWNFGNLNHSVEPFSGTLELYLWNLGTFKSGTFVRNFAEPGSRFRAAAPNHPEALLKEPQAFQAVGEKCDLANPSARDPSLEFLIFPLKH